MVTPLLNKQCRALHGIHVILGNNRFILFLSTSESAAFPSSHTLPKGLLLPQCKGKNVPFWMKRSGSVRVLLVPPVPVSTGRWLPWSQGDRLLCPTGLACPTPSFHSTAVLHLQQLPWFKIAPLGHSDISKVPKHWQAGWCRDHRAVPKPPEQRVFQPFQKIHEIVVLIK